MKHFMIDIIKTQGFSNFRNINKSIFKGSLPPYPDLINDQGVSVILIFELLNSCLSKEDKAINPNALKVVL